METQCVRIPLKPGKTDRFLIWLDTVRPRVAEMHESMTREGVVFEAMFLERAESGDAIVFYMRAKNLAAAQAAFASSALPIDVETQATINECWDTSRAAPLVVCLELMP